MYRIVDHGKFYLKILSKVVDTMSTWDHLVGKFSDYLGSREKWPQDMPLHMAAGYVFGFFYWGRLSVVVVVH